MTTQRFRVSVEIASIGPQGAQLEAILDTLAEHVADLVDVGDADLGANLAENRFTISMYIDADDQTEAAIAALTAARAALRETRWRKDTDDGERAHGSDQVSEWLAGAGKRLADDLKVDTLEEIRSRLAAERTRGDLPSP